MRFRLLAKPALLLFSFFVAVVTSAVAQDNESDKEKSAQPGDKKAKIIAERLIQTKIDGQPMVRLIDNVVLTHKDLIIYADSAIQSRKTGVVEMFGDVRIKEGDSINVTAKKLIYDESTRIVNLRDDIVFKKLNSVTLYTDFLDFDRNNQLAYYYNGGKLVDSTSTLTSRKGYYQTRTDMASFRDSVVAKSPNHTLTSDTLQYNTQTKIVFFRAETQVTDPEGNVFNYGVGTYDASGQKSDLSNGIFETESYDLTGKRVFADDASQYYRATGDVEMLAKENDIIIIGDLAEHWKDTGITKVYGNALMKKATEQGDTLFLSADTLVSIDPEADTAKRLLAYHNVKIYKSDLQGLADSLAYIFADSMIHFYTDPVLWNNGNQLTADSINLELANNVINRLNMSVNSFVIAQDTVLNFNQIKGRDMVARFNEGKIDKVDVYGNGESLYFAIDEERDNLLMGMNKILCANMTINFKESDVDNIMFYINPDAEFIPPHELQENQKQLKGFQWRSSQRPSKTDVVPYAKEESPVEDKEEQSLDLVEPGAENEKKAPEQGDLPPQGEALNPAPQEQENEEDPEGEK